MDTKKLIVLMAVVTLWVNYENYISQEQDKLHRQVPQLKERIEREERLIEHYSDAELLNELKTQSPYTELTYPKSLGYSEAMGKLQELVSQSAQDRCSVKRTDWGESAKSDTWYERLRMRVELSCIPKSFVEFENALHDSGKLIQIENMHIYKNEKKRSIEISMQMVAYRLRGEK